MNGKQIWPESEVWGKGIFSSLPEREWKTSREICPPSVFERKSVLFREGDAAGHVYLVGGGLVKTFKKPPNDRIQIVNIMGAGDVVGTEALTRGNYTSSAATLARSLLLKCEKNAFLDFLGRKPALSVAMIELLSRENAALQSLLCDVGTKKALPRVASCLLLFMEKQIEPGESRPFNIPISRQEMGAYLGLSPETVSRQLRDLSTSRVIKLEHRRLTVLNLDHLKSIARA